jgi:hypothetical protein
MFLPCGPARPESPANEEVQNREQHALHPIGPAQGSPHRPAPESAPAWSRTALQGRPWTVLTPRGDASPGDGARGAVPPTSPWVLTQGRGERAAGATGKKTGRTSGVGVEDPDSRAEEPTPTMPRWISCPTRAPSVRDEPAINLKGRELGRRTASTTIKTMKGPGDPLHPAARSGATVWRPRFTSGTPAISAGALVSGRSAKP